MTARSKGTILFFFVLSKSHHFLTPGWEVSVALSFRSRSISLLCRSSPCLATGLQFLWFSFFLLEAVFAFSLSPPFPSPSLSRAGTGAELLPRGEAWIRRPPAAAATSAVRRRWPPLICAQAAAPQPPLRPHTLHTAHQLMWDIKHPSPALSRPQFFFSIVSLSLLPSLSLCLFFRGFAFGDLF